MPADRKEQIAETAKMLLTQRHRKKITVKDIVDECHITRQAFYYHFEDIPALLCWMIRQDTRRNMEKAQTMEDGEARLRYLFVMAINALPYVKKGMAGSYREELERFLDQHLQRLFEQVCDEEDLYQDCTRFEARLILRYHSQAILGLLRNWTQADTRDLDQIVHTVFRLVTEGISPHAGH